MHTIRHPQSIMHYSTSQPAPLWTVGPLGPLAPRPLGASVPPRGFTLTEMIVAVAVSALMLGLVSQIFLSTQQAVRRGIGISDSVAGTRPVAQQLALDAKHMLGPQDGKPGAAGGGLLVIHSHTINNVSVPRPGAITGEITRSIRDDQLLFIRRAAGIAPITPEAAGNLVPYAAGDPQHARVWYGHLVRTTAAGAAGPGLGKGDDVLGTDWMLGRQALLMDPSVPASVTHSNGFGSKSLVTGPSVPGGTVLGLGYTDLVNRSLDDLIVALSSGSYKDIAEALLYLDKYSRLHVNPTPTLATGSISTFAVAQTHAFLMNHVSDVLVEFAADVNLDGKIDTVTGGNAIQWYGGVADAAAGVAVPPDTYPPKRVQGSDVMFVWQHNDEDDGTGKGAVTGSTTQVSYWPYLVRIRYRVHDKAGLLSTPGLTDGQSGGGFWFEHVFRVRRP